MSDDIPDPTLQIRRDFHAALAEAAETYAAATGQPRYLAASIASAWLHQHAQQLHEQESAP